MVAIVLFNMLPRAQALLWTVVGGQMFLPAFLSFKIPMIPPPFDKNSIPNLCILVGCLLTRGPQLRKFDGSGWVGLLVGANLLAPILSVFENQNQIFIGGSGLPPADFYNAGSAVISTFLTLVPFLLGRQFLCRFEDTKELFRILVIAGLIYTIPTLI